MKDAGERARARLAELERELIGLQTDLRALDERHRAALKTREDRHARDRRALEHERAEALSGHDQTQAERRARHAAERAAIETERDQALGAAGVDTTTLNRLEQEAAAVQAQLARIDAARGEVGQWHLWQANDWPRRETHVRAATAARAELAAEERRWQARAAELDAVRQRLDREHERLERDLAAIRTRLDAFRQWPPDPEVQAGPYDPAWTLAALAEQANANQAEAAGLVRTITRLVERIKGGFIVQRDTPPDRHRRGQIGDPRPPILETDCGDGRGAPRLAAPGGPGPPAP